MKYKNEYKIIEGKKEEFEKEINKLSEDSSWIWCSQMNTMPTREGMHYSTLMQKSTKVTESINDNK